MISGSPWEDSPAGEGCEAAAGVQDRWWKLVKAAVRILWNISALRSLGSLCLDFLSLTSERLEPHNVSQTISFLTDFKIVRWFAISKWSHLHHILIEKTFKFTMKRLFFSPYQTNTYPAALQNNICMSEHLCSATVLHYKAVLSHKCCHYNLDIALGRVHSVSLWSLPWLRGLYLVPQRHLFNHSSNQGREEY